jgi:hypothetical protein
LSCNGESYSSIMRFSLVFHSSWDSEWQTLDISNRPWRVLLIINWKGKDVLIIFFLTFIFSRMLLYPSISVSDGFKQFLPDESRPVYATLPEKFNFSFRLKSYPSAGIYFKILIRYTFVRESGMYNTIHPIWMVPWAFTLTNRTLYSWNYKC